MGLADIFVSSALIPAMNKLPCKTFGGRMDKDRGKRFQDQVHVPSTFISEFSMCHASAHRVPEIALQSVPK